MGSMRVQMFAVSCFKHFATFGFRWLRGFRVGASSFEV